MNFVLTAAAVLGILGAALGAGLALWLRRSSSRWNVFRLLLLVPLVPFGFHVYWTYRYSVGWIDMQRGQAPVGAYPGSTAFAAAALLTALIAVALALWLSSRIPLLSALHPALLFTVYFNFVLPLLQWRAPFEGPILDNMPNVWLFLLFVACTASLLAFAWIALPRWSRSP